ncbi:MAG: diguanylate cyclase [Sulfurimicrobium sp.]|nr:diguanylate cyclase [Sulfurimicrobium sp.]MDO9188745.1 diguanylate cyclase [Sulfurimicrobium sp.]MDP2961485.1 diguanylate cyclase [Sulfurimicrobium sp.]MDZ7656506.1 diguanylate cyclase [Sulfurimicrobium sp.]
MNEMISSPLKKDNPYRVVWGAQRFRLSIGWKTLVAFFVVAFIPLIGVTMLVDNILVGVARQHISGALATSLHSAQAAHASRLGTVNVILSHSASAPGVKEALSEKKKAPLVDLLQDFAFNLPFVDAWLAMDTKGNVIARRNGSAGDQVALNTILPQVMSNGYAVVSTEALSRDIFLRENPERFLRLERVVMASVVAVPVMKDGGVIGVLIGMVLLDGYDWLPNLIHDGSGDGTRLFGALVQESRVVAASRRPGNFWAEGQLLPVEVSDLVLKGRPFNGPATINNEPCFISAEPILNAQKHVIGSLVVGSKAGAVDAFIRGNMLTIYGFLVLGGFLSIVIAFLAYRDTIRPIRALVGAMDDFAAGKVDVRTEISTKDEFDDLGKGFNRMADAVYVQQMRVEKYNSLAKLLITTLNPKELLKNALDKVLELTDSKLGVIYLMNEQTEVLAPFVTYGVDLAALPPLKMGEGIAGFAAQERHSVVLEHIPEKCYIRVDLGFAEALPSEVAAFPLMYKEKVLGVMLLGTFGHYQTEEQPLIEYLANQIAITLDNALTHEKVERLSIADGLTGLYNRRFLSERLEEEYSKAIRYETPLSLLVMDVDFFKRVNDTFGHQIGDNALITVARVLQQSVRESDLVGRYGGEEFVVLLPHTDFAKALTVAEKIRLAVSEAPVEGMGERRLTISIGAAGFPDLKVSSMEEMVRKADEALYRAKEGGRNQVVKAE